MVNSTWGGGSREKLELAGVGRDRSRSREDAKSALAQLYMEREPRMGAIRPGRGEDWRIHGEGT